VRLARDGARVAVNARVDDERLRAVVAECGGLAAPADIAEPQQVATMIAAAEAELGPIEILICNAARMSMKPFLEQDPAVWRLQIDINVGGHLDVIAAALPGMRSLGRGRIVIISSYWGIIGWQNATGYAASKSGLIALGKSLARELAPDGIAVSVVLPGVIDTPQLEVDARDAGLPLPEMHKIYAQGIPCGRIGRADEVAAAVAFLAGAAGWAYAGQMIQPNGGELRCTA
jgi:NAD(P)-dependent dehydrogenase (short-subunit alcohol dehydrogenase family)